MFGTDVNFLISIIVLIYFIALLVLLGRISYYAKHVLIELRHQNRKSQNAPAPPPKSSVVDDLSLEDIRIQSGKAVRCDACETVFPSANKKIINGRTLCPMCALNPSKADAM